MLKLLEIYSPKIIKFDEIPDKSKMRYNQSGNIPQKRHTVFKSPEDKFYYEQLFGTEGFHGISSLLYHIHRPTQIKSIGAAKDVTPKIAVDKNVTPRMFKGMNVTPEDDFMESRKFLMVNNDLKMGLSKPRKSMDYFYKNAECDELLYAHHGSGILKTFVGDLEFSVGDYLIIPRGTIYQVELYSEDTVFFVVESHSPIYTPKRYRNEFGQLLEHSPFCERDIIAPTFKEPKDEKGEFLIKVKKENQITDFIYATHPFDVVGWDGYFYPYKFNIKNFEPITGRIHQPPPIHQTFEAHNFVVCSFCARMYDYHPLAIPAPYNHSNIDSDEVLFYTEGDFMSRNHIDLMDFTLHPGGIVHGPHPGAMERSIGKKFTEEYAVMVDPFRPLKITEEAMKVEDPSYKTSWLESEDHSLEDRSQE